MSKAKPKTTTKAARWRATEHPRNAQGRFAKKRPEATPTEQAATMAALYEWRDARREYDQQLVLARREDRIVGVRSLAIFTLMSAVLVGMLVAGVAAQAGS